EVPWEKPPDVTRTVRDYRVLYLSPDSLDADVPTINHIPMVNRDQLVVWLPQMTNRGLTECSLGSASRVKDRLKVYRAMARDMLARTNEGVWFCQDGRKKLHLDEGMRYSPGAALLMEHGIRLGGGGRMGAARLGFLLTRLHRPASKKPAE